MHLRPTALSQAENHRIAKGRSVHTLPVSSLSVFLPLRDRSVRLYRFIRRIFIFHFRSYTRIQEQEEGQCSSPLSRVTLSAYIVASVDSGAMRRDPSANDAPLPAIKTNACTTPPHQMTPQSSSPRPKPGESWLDEHRYQAILLSIVPPSQIPVKVHRIPARDPPTQLQHHPSPINLRMRTKIFLWFPLLKIHNPPLLLPSLRYSHFKNAPITFNLLPCAPTIDPTKPIMVKCVPPVPSTKRTRKSQQQRHPSSSALRHWFPHRLCSSQPS